MTFLFIINFSCNIKIFHFMFYIRHKVKFLILSLIDIIFSEFLLIIKLINGKIKSHIIIYFIISLTLHPMLFYMFSLKILILLFINMIESRNLQNSFKMLDLIYQGLSIIHWRCSNLLQTLYFELHYLLKLLISIFIEQVILKTFVFQLFNLIFKFLCFYL